jgi:hypothetical protein
MTYADVPHQGWLWRYIDDLDEWDRRLERRYDDFVTSAIDAGVDRRDLESAFDPESAVWTPVQIRDRFSTVEWRSPDAALPSQVVRVAEALAETARLVRNADVRIEGSAGRVTRDEVVLPEFDAVIRYVDAAIEDGLTSDSVRSYLDRMGFDVDSYDPLTHQIGGSPSVTPAEARKLRLEYADRLERDVLRERSIEAD